MIFKKDEITRNAGEWAELYVFLKILADGELYAADGNLDKIPDQKFPIIRVEMQKSSDDKVIYYNVDATNKKIELVLDNKIISNISMKEFKKEAQSFFEIISTRKSEKNGKNLVFKVPEISNFLEKIQNPKTKKSSSQKADIHMIIHDVMTGYEHNVGFSIKSKHAKPATLINPSGQTLFQYKIDHKSGNFDISSIKNTLNPVVNGEKRGPKERIIALNKAGYNLVFKKVKGAVFSENLTLIDSSLDHIIAECLYTFMLSNTGSLNAILKQISINNPCNYRASSQERILDHYKYKLKRLIVDSALGMVPKKPWKGEFDASGGYLVVKDTGDVLCYHLYNWNALQDYLYNNLRFETPSSTGTGSKKSFNYALYYEEDGEHYLDICLQLRFK